MGLIWQPECQKASRDCNGDKLFATDHIGHGRCSKQLVGRPVTHRFSRPPIQGGEDAAALSYKHEAAIRGKCAAHTRTARCLRIVPDCLTSLNVHSPDRSSTARIQTVNAVKKSFPHFKRRWN